MLTVNSNDDEDNFVVQYSFLRSISWNVLKIDSQNLYEFENFAEYLPVKQPESWVHSHHTKDMEHD